MVLSRVSSHQRQPWGPARRFIAALALFVFCGTTPAASSYQKKAQARADFKKAETLRSELESRPESERRLPEYQAAVQAAVRLYERVVHLAPTSPVADDSVAAAGRLLAEMGRQFRDRQALDRAAEKYRFLLKEYPGSRHAAEAARALQALHRFENEKAALERDKAVAPPGGKPAGLSAAMPAGATPVKLVQVTHIRNWATASYTRVVIELDGPAEYEAGRIANPDRIFFDLHGVRLSPAVKRQNLDGADGLLKRIRIAQNQAGIARIVLEVGPVRDYSAFLLPNPYRLVVDINGGAAGAAKPPPALSVSPPRPPRSEIALSAPSAARPPAADLKKSSAPAADPLPENSETASSPIIPSTTAPTTKPVFERVPPAKESAAVKEPALPAGREAPGREQKEAVSVVASGAAAMSPRAARPTSNGQRSLIRALGLKIGKIVIDAGHGGHDTGTIGPTGLTEKELVLDVARRLGGLIEDRLGGEVVYTRNDDVFIPLETRTAIANQKQADLFVSIHANSSRDSDARGIETYYLNFTSSEDSLEVAARENAVSEKSIHELQDLVKKITLKEKLEESREFAAEVQKSLYANMSRGNKALRNRGVKKAPFVVLIGANMPSILAEISFVSNPTDEKLLRKPEYRQRMADALYRGIQRYISSLAGIKVASLGE